MSNETIPVPSEYYPIKGSSDIYWTCADSGKAGNLGFYNLCGIGEKAVRVRALGDTISLIPIYRHLSASIYFPTGDKEYPGDIQAFFDEDGLKSRVFKVRTGEMTDLMTRFGDGVRLISPYYGNIDGVQLHIRDNDIRAVYGLKNGKVVSNIPETALFFFISKPYRILAHEYIRNDYRLCRIPISIDVSISDEAGYEMRSGDNDFLNYPWNDERGIRGRAALPEKEYLPVYEKRYSKAYWPQGEDEVGFAFSHTYGDGLFLLVLAKSKGLIPGEAFIEYGECVNIIGQEHLAENRLPKSFDQKSDDDKAAFLEGYFNTYVKNGDVEEIKAGDETLEWLDSLAAWLCNDLKSVISVQVDMADRLNGKFNFTISSDSSGHRPELGKLERALLKPLSDMIKKSGGIKRNATGSGFFGGYAQFYNHPIKVDRSPRQLKSMSNHAVLALLNNIYGPKWISVYSKSKIKKAVDAFSSSR